MQINGAAIGIGPDGSPEARWSSCAERTRKGRPARSNAAVRLCFLHKFCPQLQTRNGPRPYENPQSMSLLGVKRT
jgi:hypothetical protein